MGKRFVYTAREAFSTIPFISAEVELLYCLYLGSDFSYLGFNAVTGERDRVAISPPTLFFDNAKKLGARRLVLAHTHPGGSLLPSLSDMSTTKLHYQQASRLGLTILDHLIVVYPRYFSMRAHGHFKGLFWWTA
ncbi:MAG: JAB domain-containing protein [Spirochaetota bacterium]